MKNNEDFCLRHNAGISMITLIITIVVMIILASFAIYNGFKTPEQAQFSKFASEIANLQETVETKFNLRYGELVRQGKDFTDAEIYRWLAAGDAATTSGLIEVTPGVAASTYGSTISNVLPGDNDSELVWYVKVMSKTDKDVIEIDRTNNKLEASLPQYEDRVWKMRTSDGTVFIDPPLTYDGRLYATLEDVQKGGGDGNIYENQLVNPPVLTSNMIPVYYDGSTWRKADASNNGSQKWYDYSPEAKQWANMVTITSSKRNIYNAANVGTEVNIDDIIGFWVWIPRYAYKVGNQMMDIQFLSGTSLEVEAGYTVHPVFTSNTSKGGWNKELTGIWVAKFESSSSSTTMIDDTTSANAYVTTSLNGSNSVVATGTGKKSSTVGGKYGSEGGTGFVTVLPNITSWRSIGTSAMKTKSSEVAYQHGLSAGRIDSHMMKNTEWGAVAYLTQSKYGNTSIWTNPYFEGELYNNSSTNQIYSLYDTLTGMAGSSMNDATSNMAEKIGKSYDTTNGTITLTYQNVTSTAQSNGQYTNSKTGNTYTKTFYRYNTANGVHASTTDNIYGIYDMSGGAWEYMAAYVKTTHSNSTYYGSNVFGSVSSEFVNVYEGNTSSDTSQNNYDMNTNWMGDAVYETSNAGTGATSWNNDYSYFPYTSDPVFKRGGIFVGGSGAGVFAFNYYYGGGYSSYSFRVVLVP